MTRRVVVTGYGLVTPLGSSVDLVWKSLLAGKSGIRKISRFDASDLTCKIAGQLLSKSESEEHGFDPKDFMSQKEIDKIDYFMHYGIASATQAIEHSGILKYELNPERVGVMIGSGIGGLSRIEEAAVRLNKGEKVSPFFIPGSLINLVSGHVSIKYNFQGPNEAVVTACASGSHAISDAARIIKTGEADVMIAGSAECAICRLGIAGFAAARALSTKFNDEPESASRPWDRDRDGFVMGEGAGMLVLEEYEYAKTRGAVIYAELVGYGASGDAYHITAPHDLGRGAAKSMELALKSANLSPEDIGYINAHGTSTPTGDSVELIAVNSIFSDYAKKVPMSSTKSSIGHLLGAAGSVEAIFSILAMNSGDIPPTLNLHNPSTLNPKNAFSIDCKDWNLVPLVAQEHTVKYVLSNSFGFGGSNISLIFGKV